MIIGISGKAEAGKDTIGDFLVRTHGFHRVASANALKRIATNIFGWDGIKDQKGRQFLQELGCAVRNYRPTYWIDQALQEIQRQESSFGNKNFVITDVRFKNEAELIRKSGGQLWRVNRPGIPMLDHYSETELDSYPDFDLVFLNGGTIAQLESVVDARYRQLLQTLPVL